MIILACIVALAQSDQLESPGAQERRLQRATALATEARFEFAYDVDEEGDVIVSLTAAHAPVKYVIEYIGRELGRKVEGLDQVPRDPVIYAKLERASLEDALTWVAGSSGLYVQVGQRAIQVSEELPPYPTRQDCYKRASTALSRALLDHPRSPQAPRAAWIRADIESASDTRALPAALKYDMLVEEYPDSDLVPEAYLEAGKQYGLAGRWDTAIDRFDTLARYPKPHPFGIEARRRLAEAHTRLAEEAKNPDVQRENARRALLVLDSLDDNAPANEAFERRERLMIRARAYSMSGDPLNALRSIDLAATYSTHGDRDPALMALRAEALDRADQHEDAFLAWLQAAEFVEGAARAEAYRRAAASANDSGAHIAAIATCKTAEKLGLGRALDSELHRANVALGLDSDVGTLLGDRDKIGKGERYFTARRYQESIDVLRPVYDRRFGLERGDRQRLALTYARALERSKRLDEAIHVLRTAAQESEYAADRTEIYQAASTLYERNQDIERAISALEGAL